MPCILITKVYIIAIARIGKWLYGGLSLQLVVTLFIHATMASTLRKYLLPPQDFEGTIIPQIEILDKTKALATEIHNFRPLRCRPERIPFHVALAPELPTMIRNHLENILNSEYSEAIDSFANDEVKEAYRSLQRFCEGHRFNVSDHQGKEPSITSLADHIADPVKAIYRHLTNSRVFSEHQIRTCNCQVEIDRTYTTEDQKNIFWEDMAIPAFDTQIVGLIDRLKIGVEIFPDKGQVSWDGADAILAKAGASLPRFLV